MNHDYFIWSLIGLILLALTFTMYRLSLGTQKLKYELKMKHQEELIMEREKILKTISIDLHSNIKVLLHLQSLNIYYLKTKSDEPIINSLTQINNRMFSVINKLCDINKKEKSDTLDFKEQLESLIELYNAHPCIKIDYEINIPQNLMWKRTTEHSIIRIIQEVLANITHHTNADYIQLKIGQVIEDKLPITIEAPFTQINTHINSSNMGMKIIANRAKKMNIEYQYTYNEKTFFHMQIPINTMP